MGFYRNALDRSEGAQQNEGSHIPAYTGSNTAVHHAAGGAEQAHGLIAGGSEQEASVSQYGRLAHRRLNHPHWSLHDIRRTFTTMLNDLGVDPHVVEQLTGHQMQECSEFIIIPVIWMRNAMRWICGRSG